MILNGREITIGICDDEREPTTDELAQIDARNRWAHMPYQAMITWKASARKLRAEYDNYMARYAGGF